MAVRIFEIDPAPSVVVIGLIRLPLTGVGPIAQVPLANSVEYRLEFSVTDQEGRWQAGGSFLTVSQRFQVADFVDLFRIAEH
ncbi:hypothetical protein [Rhizobium leguminosarum]|uniref:hypothetical protein n=1 Tax=Rhizobium leguminosarum TaxID=384 RepID=UPI00143F7715|nr:hypothetical protein [Rhizobium leguminosarum]